MRDVAILSAVRTPIGRAPKGVLRNTRPDDLGALVVKEAIRRAEVTPAQIEDLVFGCAQPESEQGLNIGRIIGPAVAGFLIRSGRNDVVNVAGGMQDWAAAGRPMATDSGAPPVVA